MNTFLNYIPGILPVVVGLVAINLHIKTSKHNFAFENQKLRTTVIQNGQYNGLTS